MADDPGSIEPTPRRLVAFLCVLGLLTVAGVASLVLVVKDSLTVTGSATTSAMCAGTTVELTVGTWPGRSSPSPAVFGRVTIFDYERRWEVQWDTEPAATVLLAGGQRPTVGASELGDTDDGLSGQVRVRPYGTQTWCVLSADFS